MLIDGVANKNGILLGLDDSFTICGVVTGDVTSCALWLVAALWRLFVHSSLFSMYNTLLNINFYWRMLDLCVGNSECNPIEPCRRDWGGDPRHVRSSEFNVPLLFFPPKPKHVANSMFHSTSHQNNLPNTFSNSRDELVVPAIVLQHYTTSVPVPVPGFS